MIYNRENIAQIVMLGLLNEGGVVAMKSNAEVSQLTWQCYITSNDHKYHQSYGIWIYVN